MLFKECVRTLQVFALCHFHNQVYMNYSGTHTTSNYLASTAFPERKWKKNAHKLYLVCFPQHNPGEKTCFSSGMFQMLYKHSSPSF